MIILWNENRRIVGFIPEHFQLISYSDKQGHFTQMYNRPGLKINKYIRDVIIYKNKTNILNYSVGPYFAFITTPKTQENL